jgi:hypothetical protein
LLLFVVQVQVPNDRVSLKGWHWHMKRFFYLTIPLLALCWLGSVPTAEASAISFVDIFGNAAFEQTGNGNTLSLNGAFFSADLNSTVANAYTSASVSYPGPGSPRNLAQTSPTDYHFQTPFFSSLSAMETAYPFGTYTFHGVDGGGTDTATLDYTADDYPQSNPYLTGTDYTSLQGMNAGQNFTLHFSPFVAGSNATDSFIFFTIFDETKGMTVFNDGFLPSTTTSVLLPAGTLTPGDLFDYELDYSNRDIASGLGGAEFAPQLGFDVRSDGVFTTAATPEPRSYAAVLGVALVMGLLLRRRRNAFV